MKKHTPNEALRAKPGRPDCDTETPKEQIIRHHSGDSVAARQPKKKHTRGSGAAVRGTGVRGVQ